jgi:hypothetical protein
MPTRRSTSVGPLWWKALKYDYFHIASHAKLLRISVRTMGRTTRRRSSPLTRLRKGKLIRHNWVAIKGKWSYAFLASCRRKQRAQFCTSRIPCLWANGWARDSHNQSFESSDCKRACKTRSSLQWSHKSVARSNSPTNVSFFSEIWQLASVLTRRTNEKNKSDVKQGHSSAYLRFRNKTTFSRDKSWRIRPVWGSFQALSSSFSWTCGSVASSGLLSWSS